MIDKNARRAFGWLRATDDRVVAARLAPCASGEKVEKKTSDVMCRQGPVVYKRRDVFVSVFSLTTTWDDSAALASLTAPRQTPP